MTAHAAAATVRAGPVPRAAAVPAALPAPAVRVPARAACRPGPAVRVRGGEAPVQALHDLSADLAHDLGRRGDAQDLL
ncbi:hypothetical protein, partial [Actinomadura rubrisoli]|uniref:hypothetical protein n=1 Tax=Actinomadura rubrisoli TaxID=2530368 RepID=UPI002442D077